MSDYIIKVENLGKKYSIQHQGERERYVALRDVLARKATAPLRWLRARSAKSKEQSAQAEEQSASVKRIDPELSATALSPQAPCPAHELFGLRHGPSP